MNDISLSKAESALLQLLLESLPDNDDFQDLLLERDLDPKYVNGLVERLTGRIKVPSLVETAEYQSWKERAQQILVCEDCGETYDGNVVRRRLDLSSLPLRQEPIDVSVKMSNAVAKRSLANPRCVTVIAAATNKSNYWFQSVYAVVWLLDDYDGIVARSLEEVPLRCLNPLYPNKTERIETSLPTKAFEPIPIGTSCRAVIETLYWHDGQSPYLQRTSDRFESLEICDGCWKKLKPHLDKFHR